jgi:hypothetical protein
LAVATKLRNDSSILSVNISSAGYHNHSALAQRRPDVKQRLSKKWLPVTPGVARLKTIKIQAGAHSLFAFASSIRNFSIRSSDKPVFHASQGSVSVIYPFIF